MMVPCLRSQGPTALQTAKVHFATTMLPQAPAGGVGDTRPATSGGCRENIQPHPDTPCMDYTPQTTPMDANMANMECLGHEACPTRSGTSDTSYCICLTHPPAPSGIGPSVGRPPAVKGFVRNMPLTEHMERFSAIFDHVICTGLQHKHDVLWLLKHSFSVPPQPPVPPASPVCSGAVGSPPKRRTSGGLGAMRLDKRGVAPQSDSHLFCGWRMNMKC